MESMDKEEISKKFYDVKSIKSFNADGMILYSIFEMKIDIAYRQFVFVNWHNEGKNF